MLNIHNGDSAAEIARQSSLPGEHFAWREALIEGPTPANVNSEQWRDLRAHHLSESYEVDLNETKKELRIQEEKLFTYGEHDEVVLWFEHDLFCQINLLYLLDWFAQRDLGKTKLSLVFIGEFAGFPNFRGLGQLTSEQMASLFPARQQVSSARLNLARVAWEAYRSADPSSIEKLLKTDTSSMPFLRDALLLHLERFPYVSNGLGRIQNRGLGFIKEGLRTFADLFTRFGEAEPSYGLGDTQFWTALKQISDVRQPLLKMFNGGSSNESLQFEKLNQLVFEITDLGTEVINDRADFVEMNGMDLWLGGVHLSGKQDLWRWDDRNQRLAFL